MPNEPSNTYIDAVSGKVLVSSEYLYDIADAIRDKKSSLSLYTPAQMAPAIASIPSGGGDAVPTAECGEVNFLDYDGKIVASCTIDELNNMTAFPAAPAHTTLTAQGWNYELSYAKEYAATYKMLNIGQSYMTDDGSTRLYISIANIGRMTVPLYFSQTDSECVRIDWGDGSAVSVVSGTGNVNTSHVYQNIGDYVITMMLLGDCELGLGNGSSATAILGEDKVYKSMLRRVEIGDSVTTITSYAFDGCYGLTSVSIPNGVTVIGNSSFNDCRSLTGICLPASLTVIGTNVFSNCSALSVVSIPEGQTAIGNSAFSDCNSLRSISLPNSLQSIGSNAFYNCYSLAMLVIPSGVAQIAAGAFQNCTGLGVVEMTPIIPPELSNVNALQNIPADCTFYVSHDAGDNYRGATNWSTIALQIEEHTAG